MRLDKVQISQFRNIKDAVLEPASCLNIIIGENGSGKSSLLEALHYISYGRSFRTNKYQHLINHNADRFTLFAQASHIGGHTDKVGVTRTKSGHIEMKINGERLSRIADFASTMPTQVFTPQSSELLSGSPGGRRSFVDWGLFHVKQKDFFQISKVYAKVIKQRNASLKARSLDPHQQKYWLDQIAVFGDKLDVLRQDYIQAFTPVFYQKIDKFLPEFSFDFAYYRGWEKGLALSDSLAKSQTRDAQYGFTGSGPHKADLKIKVQGKPVQEVLSRGQLRLLTAALQLAQSQLLYEFRQESCLFLLDDLGAELDEHKRKMFLQQLVATDAQIFVSATEPGQVIMDDLPTRKVFHVEHGQVNEEKIING